MSELARPEKFLERSRQLCERRRQKHTQGTLAKEILGMIQVNTMLKSNKGGKMRKSCIILLLTGIGFLLFACGQKGELFLPSKDKKPSDVQNQQKLHPWIASPLRGSQRRGSIDIDHFHIIH